MSRLHQSGDEAALLIYTSGSTGSAPKAVVSRHRQIRFATGAIGARIAYQENDVVFCRLPLSFDSGLYQAFLCAQAGSQLVLAGPEVNPRLVSELNRCVATVIPLVPSIAAMLIGLSQRTAVTAPIRLLTNTGEQLTAQTAKQLRACFPAASVVLMFGTTECKRICIMEPSSWPAVAACEQARLEHSGGFTAAFEFRRCPLCDQINIIKEDDFVCAACDGSFRGNGTCWLTATCHRAELRWIDSGRPDSRTARRRRTGAA